jgi:Uncharacterized protein conserved in bacteria (DUF2188)
VDQIIFTVRQRDDTRWHVCGAGSPRSLASFGFKEDAIEYARDLARSWSVPADGQEADATEGRQQSSDQEASRIGARAAASLAAGAIKKPAMSRA